MHHVSVDELAHSDSAAFRHTFCPSEETRFPIVVVRSPGRDLDLALVVGRDRGGMYPVSQAF